MIHTIQVPPTATKKTMLETINNALSKHDGIPVQLTNKAVLALRKDDHNLEYAYKWAWYYLNWQYGRMYSDDKQADYSLMLDHIAYSVKDN